MFDCRQDERTFWKTMNPSRLHALFNAWFKPARRQGENSQNYAPAIAANGKPTRYVDLDVPAGNQKSLVQYLTGG